MKTAVIKLGGELLDDDHERELAAIARDVRRGIDGGHSIVLVHGGGPQTTALQRLLGQEPKAIGGRRVTDEAALDVIKMVVGGRLNIDFCSALITAGVRAVGLNGVSGRAIACEKRPPRVVSGGGDQPIDFGFVGDVTGVNGDLISMLIDHGYTPVLACIGSDACGRPYNINADVVASGVAVALRAERLFLVTNTPGVLRDVNDSGSRIARIGAREAKEAIASGSVKGGMIPKIEESLEALARGVREVVILGRLADGDLLGALGGSTAVGTIVAAD
jgi:acetylglutamate kinase